MLKYSETQRQREEIFRRQWPQRNEEIATRKVLSKVTLN
jgi:hypothetical protein